MLVKASIAATLVIGVVAFASSSDFRALYNDMYPVNGLKRDVLGVCHQAKPTFVRAVEADRVLCYDSMPDPVETAIGWVRTSSRLAAMRKEPTAMESAERLLDSVVAQRQANGIEPAIFTGYVPNRAVATPCDTGPVVRGLAPVAMGNNAPAAKTDERLAQRLTNNDSRALAALGLGPRGAKPNVVPEQKLPAIPLAGAPNTAPVAAATNGCRPPA